MRDPSSIAIGIVLPVILILLFGYGLSLDVTNVPVAVVLEDSSADARELAAGFQLSPYFERGDAHVDAAGRAADARPQGRRHRPHPSDFSRRLAAGDAEVQILRHGTDANRARIIEGYAQGADRAVAGAARAPRAQRDCRRRRHGRRAGCGSTRPTTATISWCPA